MSSLFESLSEVTTQKHLFDKRVIVLSDAVHSASAKTVIELLLALESRSVEPIWLFLNSPGGEVNSGFGIYDIMRFLSSEVKVVVTGLAASIATIILLGAKKEHRFSMPNAKFLIHQPLIRGNIQGQASDIEIHAQEILKTRAKIVDIYHHETGQPLERIQRDIERDYWMNTQESLDYGLIHRVVNRWDELQA